MTDWPITQSMNRYVPAWRRVVVGRAMGLGGLVLVVGGSVGCAGAGGKGAELSAGDGRGRVEAVGVVRADRGGMAGGTGESGVRVRVVAHPLDGELWALFGGGGEWEGVKVESGLGGGAERVAGGERALGGDRAVGVEPMVGGVQGGRSEGVSVRRHRVAVGETLWSIARAHYGDGRRSGELLEANRGQLPGGAGSLRVGMELVLP